MKNGKREDWFWDKVDKSGDCWLWTACTRGSNNYGAFKLDGRHQPAHRISFMWATGIDPGVLCVLHKCDTPRCVNPDHLFLGTPADNAADRDQKGRTARGERAGGVKLTEEQVITIRWLHDNGLTLRALAAMYGVSYSNIGRITTRDTWRHI
jgi:hypothetical protein